MTTRVPAIVGQSRSLSGSELRKLALAAAASVKEGERVAFIARCDIPTVAAVLGVWLHGGVMVPVHPESTPEERDAWLSETGARWLGASDEVHPSVKKRDAKAPLAILRTSGSSGTPRYVALSERAFVASSIMSGANLGWAANDRWMLSIPPSHVGGLSIITRCLLTGHTIAVPGATSRFKPRAAVEFIRSNEITMVSWVPTMLRRVVSQVVAGELNCLRVALIGGAPCSDDLKRKALELGIPVVRTYGMTETCSQIATEPPGTDGLRLLAGVDASVSETGRLIVRGPNVMNGYLGEAPLDRKEYWESSDRVVLNDDHLTVLGRADDTIISGGENVEPTEVEQVLEKIRGVVAACVVGLPDPEWGERVVAALEWRDRARPEAVSIALSSLPKYKRPKSTVAMSLPRSTTGKVLRAKVRAQLIAVKTG